MWNLTYICCVVLVIETGEEAVEGDAVIGLDHSKWVQKLRKTYEKGDLARFNMLGQQYQMWCNQHGVPPENLGLEDIDIPEEEAIAPTAQAATTTATATAQPQKIVKMSVGTTLNHNLTPLSPFLDKCMKTKSGYVPITVFDKLWLEMDANLMRSKSTKISCSVELSLYNGSKIRNEWRLTYKEWAACKRLFLRYWREVYAGEEGKVLVLEELLAKHFENVETIAEDLGGAWPPAARYDIHNRMNVWAFRLPDGSMADVGEINKTLLATCIRVSKDLDEMRFTDNPCAYGHTRQHVSPIDGSVHSPNSPWDATVNPMSYDFSLAKGRMISHLISVPKETGGNQKSNNQAGQSHSQSRAGNFSDGGGGGKNNGGNGFNNRQNNNHPNTNNWGNGEGSSGGNSGGGGWNNSWNDNGGGWGNGGKKKGPLICYTCQGEGHITAQCSQWSGSGERPKIGPGSFERPKKQRGGNGGEKNQK